MKKTLLYLFLINILLLSCSPNNVTVDDSVKKYFDSLNVTGCFGLFDNGQGDFTVYNLARYRDSAYSPASTFKIVNSLIGLQTGRVTNEKTVFKWDSISINRAECEREMTMEDAFRLSCPNWYRQLSRKIGKDTLQRWIDSLGYASKYGNFNITNNVDMFWLDNSMKITADEELGLVKKLYFNQLPFQKRPQEIVKKLMLWESNSNYNLSYKTGWAELQNGHTLGWVVGWIEENNHVYFFVLQVEAESKNIDIKAVQIELLKKILGQYGFF